MFDRLVKALAGTSLAIVLCVPAGFAQDAATPGSAPAAQGAPAAPKVKDQGEYDAMAAIQKETDPAKKLDLLKAWQDKYPETEFKSGRLLQFMNAWSQVASKTLQTPPTPDTLSQGKTAAQNLLDNLDKAFSTEGKPANVTDDQWRGARAQVEQQAHLTLGWIGLQSKDYPASEEEFKKFIALNDQNAQVAYWLGTAIASEHKVERTPEALYQFARAVVITGPAALNPDGKKTADTYLTKAWNGYHGDDDAPGLAALKDTAAKSAMPPSGFAIESVVDREKKKAGSEEAYLAAHPDIKLWRDLKAALTAPDGDDYFTKNMKGMAIPKTFSAKVVSFTPDPNPTEIKVSIDDPAGDATIKYEKPLKAKVEVGQTLQIEGNSESYTKDPFMIVFNGETSKIKGITMDKPAPAKRPAARRRR